MSQLPAMPVWWADFFSKTDHLSNEEQWAYAKLMAKTWLRNCKWFPDEPRDLARLLGMTVERWLKVRPRLVPFFDLSGGLWRQEHLETVWGNVQERVAISQRNGRQGGRPKINKTNDIENPAGLLTKTQSEPNQSQRREDIPEARASGLQTPRDQTKEVFDRGLLIVGTDKRALLGKLRKQYGEVALLEAIYETERECPIEPLKYLIGCCKRSKSDGPSHSRAVDILGQAARDADERQGNRGDPEASAGPAWGAEELGDGSAALYRLPVRYSA